MPDQDYAALFRGHARADDLAARLGANNFDGHVGTEWLDMGPDEARARLAVEPHHSQPLGSVHGGVFATLAESIASAATYTAVVDDGMIAVGQSNATTFVRPIVDGHLNALARPRHRGSSTWVWDVEITDDDGRLCGLSRIAIAVRPAR